MNQILKNIVLASLLLVLAAPAMAAEGGMALLPPVPALPRLEPSWMPAGSPTVLGVVDLLGADDKAAVLWLGSNRAGAAAGQDPLGPPAVAGQAANGLGGEVGVTLRPLAGADLSASVGRLGKRTDVALSVATSSARLGMLYLYDANPGSGGEKGMPLLILPRSGASLLANGAEEQPLRTYGLYGDLALGDKVGVHWAVGYAALANGERDAKKKAWEYNVGIAYRVLGNLLYEAHFGYMTTDGDEPPAAEGPADGAAVGQAATIDQVYLITNKVTMHF